MLDLPPQVLSELCIALVGVFGGVALVLRGVPAAARACGELLERFLSVLERWSETNAATTKAMTDHAITAELEAQGLRREKADLERLLKAEVEENARLRVQDASDHQRRG